MEKEVIRFIVRVNDSYYVTSGENLVYDPERARNDAERDGVEKVGKMFREIHDHPSGRFDAVILSDDSFSCENVNRND